MKDYDAVMIVEGVQEPESPVEYLEAIAHLIKTGMAWTLQGFFGRTCAPYIEGGIISSEGEILIDEEAIWNLFGEEYE
jgi:hypothetical protein